MKFIHPEISLLALLAAAAVQLVYSASLEQVAEQRSQITVKSLGGPSKRVDFSESETVAELKRRIATLDGTQVSTLKLVFAGKQLEDDRLLSDYGIQPDSSVISLQGRASVANPKSIDSSRPIEHLFIKTITGDTIEVPADRDLTVGQLKAVIELYKENVAAEKQQLIYNGIVLEDYRTLAQSGLVDGATITLTINMASGRARATVTRAVLLTDKVKRRLVASLVAKINNGQQHPKFNFKHDAQFARVRLVEGWIDIQVASHLPDDAENREIMSAVFKSDDLQAEFSYEYKGKREFFRANLKAGAQWVADQAQSVIDAEQFERDLALHKQKESKRSQN